MSQNSSFDKTQKLKLWKILKNSNCDKTQKLKLWQNFKYDKCKFIKKRGRKHIKRVFLVRTFWHLDNQRDVLWAAIAILAMFPSPVPSPKLKLWEKKLKKLKMWQNSNWVELRTQIMTNSRTQIVTKLKNSNYVQS